MADRRSSRSCGCPARRGSYGERGSSSDRRGNRARKRPGWGEEPPGRRARLGTRTGVVARARPRPALRVLHERSASSGLPATSWRADGRNRHAARSTANPRVARGVGSCGIRYLGRRSRTENDELARGRGWLALGMSMRLLLPDRDLGLQPRCTTGRQDGCGQGDRDGYRGEHRQLPVGDVERENPAE